MNKRLIVGILFILLIFLVGFAYVNEVNKADTSVPYINSHLQDANNEYNTSVTFLNSKNYNEAMQHCNLSYVEYSSAKINAENALDKAIKNNQQMQIEYFTYTISELDLKINATVEMYNGLIIVNNRPQTALTYFDNANRFMKQSQEYSDKRILLEEQNPEIFIKEV